MSHRVEDGTSRETFVDMIEQARKWPREGFGEGRWFHAMADWMERARTLLSQAADGPMPHAMRYDIEALLTDEEQSRG